MTNLKYYNLIRLLAAIFFVAIAFEYWGNSFIGLAVLLFPYILVFLLANKLAYRTKLRTILRTFAGLLVSVLAIGLLFGIKSDAQSGIVVSHIAISQYSAIFVAEAIIGLCTYEDNCT
ncbi:hypothetical protein [Shewanella polaris]|uniref:Uncharacterized protein n=1 Tax=Shewanella polaris TaxID=2588449 RepID=A0A4Y5YGR7_9GAMM|nr:hypothetical protein [Shewanella polaris]QDE31729.1 hypothetical protein FH971_12600 [Shewanella polaris]